MRYNILDTPHIHYECLNIAAEVIGGESPTAVKDGFQQKHPEQAARLDALFAPLEALFAHVAPAIDPQDDTLRFLFAAHESLSEPLWLILSDIHLRGSRAMPVVADAFAEYLEDDALRAIHDDAGLAAAIAAKQLPCDAQAKLLLLLLRREALLDYFDALIARLSALFVEKQGLVTDLCATAAARLRAEMEAYGFQAFFTRYGLPISLDEGEDEYVLYPHLFHANSLFLYSTSHNDLLMGVYLIELSEMAKDRRFSQARLLEVLKVLSDKTKLDMLAMLSREELYGSQLAERTGLTTATISYHIHQLTSLRLLHIVKRETRIYYRADQELIARYLDACKALLTGQA